MCICTYTKSEKKRPEKAQNETKRKNYNTGGCKMSPNSFDRLFWIDKALLQEVTHQGVVVAEGRSSEAVVFIRVPLKGRKSLVSVTTAG